MLLRPRKFIFKNIHKRRGLRRSKAAKLVYGHFGLKLLQPLRLNSKQVFRYKIFLKKAVRKSDKTCRRAWFNVFPYLPISKKVTGSRMGKGKGKLAG
jgi:ribosomal protein L16/L10AE